MGNNPAVLRLKKVQFVPGSVVLITGATSGIGERLALRYAERGCKLVLASRFVCVLFCVFVCVCVWVWQRGRFVRKLV